METFSALLALCAGNSPVVGEFPAQRPVTRSFDVFFDLRMGTRLSKQSWGWWFETPSRSLSRHCNLVVFCVAMYISFDEWTYDTRSIQDKYCYSKNTSNTPEDILCFHCVIYVYLKWDIFCCNMSVYLVYRMSAQPSHYSDDIMSAMAYQITSLTIAYSTVYSGADQRKYQSSASLAFVRGIHRWPVNSPHKGQLRGKCLHLMTSSFSPAPQSWLAYPLGPHPTATWLAVRRSILF